ncbi:MAG: hypothetical protein ACXWT3_05675 [Methylococcaceae bacterium]
MYRNKAVVFALALLTFAGSVHAEEPNTWGICPDLKDMALPEALKLSSDQVIRLIIPDYDRKVQQAGEDMRQSKEDYEFPFSCYGAYLAISKRSDLSIPGGDFLLVILNEYSGLCAQCNYVTFGVIDLTTHRVLARAEDGGSALDLDVRFEQNHSVVVFQASDDACCGNGSIRETQVVVTSEGQSLKARISESKVIKEW